MVKYVYKFEDSSEQYRLTDVQDADEAPELPVLSGIKDAENSQLRLDLSDELIHRLRNITT